MHNAAEQRLDETSSWRPFRTRKWCGQHLFSSDYADTADAKVIQLDPLSHVGYELNYTALHGAQRYDDAINAFKIMLSKLEDTADAQIRGKP
jgi:hypothetical protein